MTARPSCPLLRKTTVRGRGSRVGGTANDMPPPPQQGRGGGPSQPFLVILFGGM